MNVVLREVTDAHFPHPLPMRERITRVPQSKIREVANAGIGRKDILPLWFGEPDMPTPDFIIEAGKAALDARDTFYQPNAGIRPLRETIAAYMTGLYGQDFDADNIVISGSGMNALMVAAQCIIEPGDAVVTTAPSWPNLPAVQQILGAEVVTVPLEAQEKGWRLDLGRLFAACGANTRCLLLNSPNNPTGWMLTREEQQEILDFARARGIWIIADEVYARIVFDRPAAPSFAELMNEDDNILIVNSLSKSWAMTGWRLGWITAPRRFLGELEKMIEFNIACPPGFVQQAGITAIRDGEDFVAETVARYRAGGDYVYERLQEFPRVFLPKVNAAFYHFVRVDGVADSMDFAKRMVAERGVGIAPGIAFGPEGEGHFRLCFAQSRGLLEQAIDRMAPLLR
jgi:aspartate/methionine/tyrosine aminotransferase